MIVVIAGHKRSGSTAQYNMIRLILGEAYGEVFLWGSETPKGKGVHLVKRHSYCPELEKKADYIFLTNRNIQDAEESLKRITGKNEKIDRYSLTRWTIAADHVAEFEHIKNYPFKCIQVLIKKLGVDVDPYKILKQFEEIKPPKQGQDPITLLYHNHIKK